MIVLSKTKRLRVIHQRVGTVSSQLHFGRTDTDQSDNIKTTDVK